VGWIAEPPTVGVGVEGTAGATYAPPDTTRSDLTRVDGSLWGGCTQGVTCGSTVKLKHSATKFHLHSHEVA